MSLSGLSALGGATLNNQIMESSEQRASIPVALNAISNLAETKQSANAQLNALDKKIQEGYETDSSSSEEEEMDAFTQLQHSNNMYKTLTKMQRVKLWAQVKDNLWLLALIENHEKNRQWEDAIDARMSRPSHEEVLNEDEELAFQDFLNAIEDGAIMFSIKRERELSHQYDLEVQKGNMTYLHVAALKNDQGFYDKLVAVGTDENAKDKDGRTPKEILEKMKERERAESQEESISYGQIFHSLLLDLKAHGNG